MWTFDAIVGALARDPDNVKRFYNRFLAEARNPACKFHDEIGA
jgi:hypothetical protein